MMRWMGGVCCLVVLGGSLDAAQLNPLEVDGFYIQASGFSNFEGGTLNSAEAISSTSSNQGPLVVAGFAPSTAVAPGGGGPFASVVDLTRGLLGSAVAGPAGTTSLEFFEGADAYLDLNLTFTGTGTATFDMSISDLAAIVTSAAGGDLLQASITASGYHFANGAVDPNIAFRAQSAGGQWCNGSLVCAEPLDNSAKDLELVLAVDPTHNQFQVDFQLSTRAAGAGAVNAANTAALSLVMSSGVGVDLSQGFLSVSQTPEPNYFGPTTTAAPEPGLAWVCGLGAIAVVFRRRLRSRLQAE